MRLEKNIEFKTGTIVLPTSKSLSNRALIIRELAGEFKIQNLSDSDDTQNLLANLKSSSEIINVRAAGTNMRFLVSLYTVIGNTKTLTGSNRMLQRPIGKLVDALRSIGANISYEKNDGFPPITIHPSKPIGGTVSIDGSESSQFISSLLMIAPLLKEGLFIQLENEPVSSSYIRMTVELMKYFGVECEMSSKNISVQSQKYTPKNYTVEADWSAAGFWYGLVAASEEGTAINVQNLSLDSIQGDRKTAEYFQKLGVETIQLSKGLRIEKTQKANDDLNFNLINEPDLFPALAFTCATLKLKVNFTGLQTLNLKESKRIDAVAEELHKVGAISNFGNDYLNITGYNNAADKISFNTHDDHRIAMAASIYCMSGDPVSIENTEVVTKSYPQFWQALKNIRIANIY